MIDNAAYMQAIQTKEREYKTEQKVMLLVSIALILIILFL